MPKSATEYLKHILDEANYLLKTSQTVTREEFMQDATLRRAFSRSLEIIGEAVKNLPDDFRQQNQKLDWKAVAGMRDRLIHHYFAVDYEIVWDVVENEIPDLKEKLEQILKSF